MSFDKNMYYRIYYQINKDKYRHIALDYYHKNKTKIALHRQLKRFQNLEVIRDKEKQYYYQNKEQIKYNRYQYYQRNIDKYKQYNKKYYQEHKPNKSELSNIIIDDDIKQLYLESIKKYCEVNNRRIHIIKKSISIEWN